MLFFCCSLLTCCELAVEELWSSPVHLQVSSLPESQSFLRAAPHSPPPPPRWTEGKAVVWGVCWPGDRGVRVRCTAATAGCG